MAGTTPRHTDTEGVDGGVGLTALLVAASRAIETNRHDSLAKDAYAEHFVRAAPACTHWPVRIEEVPDGDDNPLWGRFARYFGLRTRVLDDFVLRSAGAGARQVVLLGAGLDTRAFRLDLPTDCVVFEIDRAGVLAFKEQVLTGLSAAPEVKRVPVPVDLREDWAARSAPWVSTPPHPASGWPRDSSSTCRVPRRRISSTRWTGWPPQAVRWPSRPSWRRISWRTVTARSTRRRVG